jgi:SAM-dependent methyltransferase
MKTSEKSTFLKILEDHYAGNSFVKLTLSKPKAKQSDLQNIFISPVLLKSGHMLNFVYRYKTRDITKNLPIQAAIEELNNAFDENFLQADMYTTTENIRLMISKKGEMKLLKQKMDNTLSFNEDHNRLRKRILEPEGKIWMRETGIVNDRWEVRHEMKDKYLQLNRYIELLEPEIKKLKTSGTFKVADMGSGKGYLTFALYDYLQKTDGIDLKMTGIEYRADLVDLCNRIAEKSGFGGLEFIRGTIEETALDSPDVLIALHACNTATDDAIFKGIRSDASLIVVAPCCHKQIRRDMDVNDEMSEILKHGILLERQAEIITDGLRALLMEAHGYKTKVFEFIASEHTAKNIMIVGRKSTGTRNRDEILQKIAKIKQRFGIMQHHLENLLLSIQLNDEQSKGNQNS